MARSSLPRRVRQERYGFARRLARPFSDSRRRRFLTDMLSGLVIANHVHRTEVARAISDGAQPIHGIEKRLSLHLGSDAWDMSPLADRLLQDAAALVQGDDTLIVADTKDLAKYYARKLEGLGSSSGSRWSRSWCGAGGRSHGWCVWWRGRSGG